MKSRIKKRRIELIVIIFLAIFVPVLAGTMYRFENTETQKIASLTDGWYQMVDGEKVSLTLPATVTADEDGRLVLYNDSLTEESAGQAFSIQNVQNELNISVGSQSLYAYKSVLFERNAQMKGKLWADAVLPELIEDEPLTLSYTCEPGETIAIDIPYVGTMQSIISRHIQENYISLLIIAAMFSMGIVAILIYAYSSSRGIKDKRLMDVAIFLLLCGIWCVTDSTIYQMYGGNTAVGSILSFYSYMLLSVPVIHFVQNTLDMEKCSCSDVCLGLSYANAVGQGLLHVYFNIPFTKMLFMTHVIQLGGVVCLSRLLWKTYRKEKNEQVQICLMSFAALGGSGVLALILYWGLEIYWYDVIFQVGILLSIGIMIWSIIKQVAVDRQVLAEEKIYERISNIDRLTGLKNKKAFEKYLLMVQTSVVKPKDTVLVFIDLEGVRYANEHYGANKGDEMIIAASRCIKRTCEIFENKIKCFRIHGDEFAVVLLPGIDQNEWEKRLQREVEKYNHAGNLQIRLVCGYGYLEGKMGTIRNLSQWKGHANDDLRKNRGGEDCDRL